MWEYSSSVSPRRRNLSGPSRSQHHLPSRSPPSLLVSSGFSCIFLFLLEIRCCSPWHYIFPCLLAPLLGAFRCLSVRAHECWAVYFVFASSSKFYSLLLFGASPSSCPVLVLSPPHSFPTFSFDINYPPSSKNRISSRASWPRSAAAVMIYRCDVDWEAGTDAKKQPTRSESQTWGTTSSVTTMKKRTWTSQTNREQLGRSAERH